MNKTKAILTIAHNLIQNEIFNVSFKLEELPNLIMENLKFDDLDKNDIEVAAFSILCDILLVWFFDRSFIVDTVNLRQLSFGKRTFRGLVSSALTMCGKWMYNSINRIDMPRLESLSFGDSCLSKFYFQKELENRDDLQKIYPPGYGEYDPRKYAFEKVIEVFKDYSDAFYRKAIKKYTKCLNTNSHSKSRWVYDVKNESFVTLECIDC